jgi:two-component system sensor histidine kinase AlgZ
VKKPAAVQMPMESRAETAVPTPRQVIPDGCNLGVVLRVLLGVNLGLLLAALAGGAAQNHVIDLFVQMAGVVETVTLMSLVLWCLLRRSLPPLQLSAQRAIAWAVPAVATAVLLGLFPALREQGGELAVLAYVLVAFGAGAAIQHYLELRARAFSPAIAEARYQALQSRIRPHFFFNSLNAALAALREDPARAERMLESIAELFRAVMGDVRKLVPLAQEIDLCKKYVEIEQTRLGERLKVDWQLGPTHPRAKVPQLLLQPIIENAVRYGAEKIAGECEITVRIRQHGFNLEVFVSNPIAREPIQREGNQIGLTNIRGRLALIYDLEARLEARVRHGRFELAMTIPVENKT